MHAGEYGIPGSRPIDTNREFVVVGWVEFVGDEDEGLYVVVQCHIQLISDFMFMAIYYIYCPPLYTITQRISPLSDEPMKQKPTHNKFSHTCLLVSLCVCATIQWRQCPNNRLSINSSDSNPFNTVVTRTNEACDCGQDRTRLGLCCIERP